MCLLEAFVVQRDWLEIGFVSGKKTGLESGSSERDFFLTRPSRALGGCVLAMTRYCDAAAMTLALSRRWTCIDSLGEIQPMLLQNLASGWTEHSERSTVTTWARCCGILPEVFKRLCRWQQSCSEEYIRGSASRQRGTGSHCFGHPGRQRRGGFSGRRKPVGSDLLEVWQRDWRGFPGSSDFAPAVLRPERMSSEPW